MGTNFAIITLMRAALTNILLLGLGLVHLGCAKGGTDSPAVDKQSAVTAKIFQSNDSGINYLATGQQSLSALFQAIQSAKKSVDLSYYEIGTCDTSSKVIIRALQDKLAENPNLQIRILADPAGFKSKNYKLAFGEYVFQKLGTKIKSYNDTPTVSDTSTFRNHTKFALIDGDTNHTILISGGRNLADSYYGMNANSGFYDYEYLILKSELKQVNYVDRDVLVVENVDTEKNLSARGAGGQARAIFNRMWNGKIFGKAASSVVEPGNSELMHRARQCLSWGQREETLYSSLKFNSRNEVAVLPKFHCEKVNLLAGKPATEAVYDLLQGAHRVSMENWAYVPSEKQKSIINQLRNNNIDTRIYTNYFKESGEAIENEHLKSVGRENKKGGSVTIFPIPETPRSNESWGLLQNQGPQFLIHSKVFTNFKGKSSDVVVSSFNFDDRSESVNFETAVILNDCSGMGEYVEEYSKQLISNLPRNQESQMYDLMSGNIPNTDLWNNLKGKVLRKAGYL